MLGLIASEWRPLVTLDLQLPSIRASDGCHILFGSHRYAFHLPYYSCVFMVIKVQRLMRHLRLIFTSFQSSGKPESKLHDRS